MKATQSPLFVADDAHDEPCVWIETDHPDRPLALLVASDIPREGRDALWQHITRGLRSVTS